MAPGENILTRETVGPENIPIKWLELPFVQKDVVRGDRYEHGSGLAHPLRALQADKHGALREDAALPEARGYGQTIYIS